MDDLITKQQAQILTPKGFYRHWKLIKPGRTRLQAYELTEKLHQETDEDGERKYNDFCSFDVVARRNEKKEKAPTS